MLTKSSRVLLSQTVKVLSLGARLQGTATMGDVEEVEDRQQEGLSAKPFSEIPSPRTYPLIGNVPYFIRNKGMRPLQFSKKLKEDFGDIVKLKLTGLGENVFLLGNGRTKHPNVFKVFRFPAPV